MYEDFEDYDQYEPTEIDGLEDSIKMEASAIVDVEAIRVLIRRYIHDNFKQVLQSVIQHEVIACLKSAYSSKARFEEVLASIVEKKLDQKYPNITADKVDQLAEEIKNIRLKFGRNDEATIQKKAVDMVNNYIDTQLADEVKKTTDYLEQYSRNYFANNLFRAMGMMDKMLPVANPGSEN